MGSKVISCDLKLYLKGAFSVNIDNLYIYLPIKLVINIIYSIISWQLTASFYELTSLLHPDTEHCYDEQSSNTMCKRTRTRLSSGAIPFSRQLTLSFIFFFFFSLIPNKDEQISCWLRLIKRKKNRKEKEKLLAHFSCS